MQLPTAEQIYVQAKLREFEERIGRLERYLQLESAVDQRAIVPCAARARINVTLHRPRSRQCQRRENKL